MSVLKNILKVTSGTDMLLSSSVDFNKIYAFYSERSSGVTSVMLNTAAFLAQEGKKILIIDTNILYPASSYFLLENNQYKGKDLLNIKETDEKKDIISPTKFNNIFLLMVRENNLLNCISPKDDLELMKYILDLYVNDFDFIFIDVDKHLTNIAFQSLVLADVILQVIEESYNNLLNTVVVKSVFDLLGINLQKASYIVLNKVRVKHNVPFTISSDLGYTVVGKIPYWETFVDLGLQQKLLLNSDNFVFGVGKQVYQEYENVCKFVLGELIQE